MVLIAKKFFTFVSSITVFCSIVLGLYSAEVHAFGSKRSNPVSTEPPDTQAYPTRLVVMGEFFNTPISLPNEEKTIVDLKSLLPLLVVTEMSQVTSKIRVRASGQPNVAIDRSLPENRFELRGGITSFEASAFSGGVRFGYKPGIGDISNGATLTGAQGSVTFKIGTLGMDYHIVDHQRKEVVAVGRGNAVVGGVDLNVTLNFGDIETAADFVYRSPMTPIFRSAAREAILQMVNDPATNFYMDWTGSVTRLNFDFGKIFLNVGARDSIGLSNVFTVYDASDMRLGEIKVNSVEHEQSSAFFKNDSNQKILRSVRVGDRVKIYFPFVPR